ncbi:MAG: aldo/keto reductase [Patescibacteria group bacterium]
MEWFERLYFGTWQLGGGQFRALSEYQKERLLSAAIIAGICRFDTAAVYGGGAVEELLGRHLQQQAVIVTKIPAIRKPNPEKQEPINEFYPTDHMRRCVMNSLDRLRRAQVDTILLHNWSPSWAVGAQDVLDCLNSMKQEGLTRRIGISLPNDFGFQSGARLFPWMDVVEMPYNPEQAWARKLLPAMQGCGVEVLLRSLFGQGRFLTTDTAESLIANAGELGTSVVIGMTTEEQIKRNINCLKRGAQ